MQQDLLTSQDWPSLQHNNTNAAHLLLVGLVLVVDSTRDRRCAVVVQIEVELAIAGTELELFKEQGVVVQGEGIEDVEFGL